MFKTSAAYKKNPDQIARMRKAGRVVAEMHEAIRAAIRPGVTLLQLDKAAREVLDKRGAKSNFLGYLGYPAVTCLSPNDVVVHGIPDGRRLIDGDIISVDCGAMVGGWNGDAAFTAPVGSVSKDAAALITAAERSLDAAIAQMIAGNHLGDIGHAVQSVAEAAGCSVVRDYTGHGIGRKMHESPNIPNTGKPGKGRLLRVGDVFAVEPMLNAGGHRVVELDDGWTVVTADRSLSAHVEHTVAITEHGPEVLTSP